MIECGCASHFSFHVCTFAAYKNLTSVDTSTMCQSLYGGAGGKGLRFEAGAMPELQRLRLDLDARATVVRLVSLLNEAGSSTLNGLPDNSIISKLVSSSSSTGMVPTNLFLPMHNAVRFQTAERGRDGVADVQHG
jgi:hypothetical protein